MGAALFLGLGAPAQAAPAVDVTIEIMEASRTSKGFAGPTGRYAGQLKQLGFVGAKAIDKVTASGRSAGSKVELRFSGGRKIRVEVLSASPEGGRARWPRQNRYTPRRASCPSRRSSRRNPGRARSTL
ncbi:MAG: hypothetical protein AAFU79_27515, partial [Myxococcota bacterium]